MGVGRSYRHKGGIGEARMQQVGESYKKRVWGNGVLEGGRNCDVSELEVADGKGELEK